MARGQAGGGRRKGTLGGRGGSRSSGPPRALGRGRWERAVGVKGRTGEL